MAKFMKKMARKAGRAIKRRYVGKKGVKIGRIAKDLAIVKSMVNSEKEIYTAYNVQNAAVSPTSSVLTAVTNIAEGSGHGQRDGESVKLHGYRLNLRVSQQGSAVTDQYFKFWLVKYIGPRGTAPNVATFLKPDFDGNYSASSERNEDHYTSYQVITSARAKVPADTISGVSRYVLLKKYGRFRGKTHQRYGGTLESSLLTDQMYVIAVAANGAIGTSTACIYDAQLLVSFYDN